MSAIADIKANWSLFAIVAVVLGILVLILYESGLFSLADTLSNSLKPLGQATSNVGQLASDITEAPSTILGGNNTPVVVNNPDVGTIVTPGNSSLFWSGIKNVFTTGSIYGNQGN